MPLPSINFLHQMVSEIQPGQDYCSLHKTTYPPSRQYPYKVSTLYFKVSEISPDKILKIKVIVARTKLVSRLHCDITQLHPRVLHQKKVKNPQLGESVTLR